MMGMIFLLEYYFTLHLNIQKTFLTCFCNILNYF